NVSRAARLLGLSRSALRHRMRRLGIDRPDDAELASHPARREPLRSAPAPAPAPPSAPPVASANWGPRPVAVLAIEHTTAMGADAPGYEPWTEAAVWEQTLLARVEGFGGTVLQHGTPALAVFGLPRALDRMPERAVQAAIAIRHFA